VTASPDSVWRLRYQWHDQCMTHLISENGKVKKGTTFFLALCSPPPVRCSCYQPANIDSISSITLGAEISGMARMVRDVQTKKDLSSEDLSTFPIYPDILYIFSPSKMIICDHTNSIFKYHPNHHQPKHHCCQTYPTTNAFQHFRFKQCIYYSVTHA